MEVGWQYRKKRNRAEATQPALDVFSFHQPHFYGSIKILYNHILTSFKKYIVNQRRKFMNISGNFYGDILKSVGQRVFQSVKICRLKKY
jgi:hypothetical protein